MRAEAYGEVVWFGRRGAGAKLRGKFSSADDGGKRAVLRGEHEVSRKAIAQGRPECSSCPVCSCAVLFAQIARETAGAASTRSSLRPLNKRANEDANLGRNAPRDRGFMSPSYVDGPYWQAFFDVQRIWSAAVICPACWRGAKTAGPDDFRLPWSLSLPASLMLVTTGGVCLVFGGGPYRSSRLLRLPNLNGKILSFEYRSMATVCLRPCDTSRCGTSRRWS